MKPTWLQMFCVHKFQYAPGTGAIHSPTSTKTLEQGTGKYQKAWKLTSLPVRTCLANFTLAKFPFPIVFCKR